MTTVTEETRVAQFRRELGLDSLIDVHTHFMPGRVLDKVWAYFDAAGPLIGREWPITYRLDEDARVATLRGFGVSAFTSMLYPHKPAMAEWLNAWSREFAERTPECLHTATFFPEPGAVGYVRDAIDAGAAVFKAHVQVGAYDPTDPLLDDVWGLLADAGVPIVTHCGSGPVPGPHTGPEPIARVLARHPRLRLIVAHMGMPEYGAFLDLVDRHDGVYLDTTMAFTDFAEEFAPSRRSTGRGSWRPASGSCGAATSRTSRTATRTRWTRSPDSTRATTGSARCATTTPPGCSVANTTGDGASGRAVSVAPWGPSRTYGATPPHRSARASR